MIRKTLQTTPHNAAEHLNSDAAIVNYVQEALESGDAGLVAYALGMVARVRGMSKVAEQSGLSRESLYKILSVDGNPKFSTISQLMPALGLKLSISLASTTT